MNSNKMFKKALVVAFVTVFGAGIFAQTMRYNDGLQNKRQPDFEGINTFESNKDKESNFDGLKVVMGGAFAVQYQALKHSNAYVGNNTSQILIGLEQNTNLPTANLDLHAQLAPGMRMMLRTYLSSRHHPEPYVKDGYLQVDSLDFISKGFMSDMMQYLTITFGHKEINYGDVHFRRTDNGQALLNPFVGNSILDSFSTEMSGDIMFRSHGILAMVGASNGKLNQDVKSPDKYEPALLGKLGYDDQISKDLRVRLTGSVYSQQKNYGSIYLYSGDRAGSRYYSLFRTLKDECLNADGSAAAGTTTGFVAPTSGGSPTVPLVTACAKAGDDYSTPEFNPGFSGNIMAMMANLFVRYTIDGLGAVEVFGTYEQTKGGNTKGDTATQRTWNHLMADLIVRFGEGEKFYLAGRYNTASGKLLEADEKAVTINKIQASAGWFITKNVVMKLEYVTQEYKDFASTSKFNGGKFNGFMLESSISF